MMFEEYKAKATKRIDSCSDTLRLNKQIVAEAQTVLHTQGMALKNTQDDLLLVKHELQLKKRQEPLKMVTAVGAGIIIGTVASVAVATAF